jgi:hypothetical protein
VTIYDTAVSTAEPFYSGGICGVTGDPDIVYVGRMVDGAGNIDTINGVHQIFRMEKSGGVWTPTQLTSGSSKAFRPYVPEGAQDRLFYCEGRYQTFVDFDTRVRTMAI